MIILKQCRRCQEQKPVTDFYKQSKTKDNLQNYCKNCVNTGYKAYYSDNKEDIIKKKIEWQGANVDKHYDAVQKYNNSPTGRLNRLINNRLNKYLGKERESFLHLIGATASALITYFVDKMPEGCKIEDYGRTWVVGFIETPDLEELKLDPRKYLNWVNLKPIIKEAKVKDLNIKPDETKESI